MNHFHKAFKGGKPKEKFLFPLTFPFCQVGILSVCHLGEKNFLSSAKAQEFFLKFSR